MRKSITIAHVAGIPVKVHLNWFLIAVLVTWSLASGYFPLTYPGWTTSAYWLIGLFTAMMFFSSVLAHELGHALVAVQEAVPVNSITLFIFGGVAHIGREPSNANADFRIVVAGPFTSLILAAGFFVAGAALPGYPELQAANSYLAYMNLVLALFNMLPGYPLDGGRILRAVFWKITNNFVRATRLATFAGYGIAFLFVALGVGLILFENFFSGLWILFIGWYLGYVAYQSYQQSILFDPTAANSEVPTIPVRSREMLVTFRRPASSEVFGATFFLSSFRQTNRHVLMPQPVLVRDCPSRVRRKQEASEE